MAEKKIPFRKRFDFSKIPATIQIPNLIEVQKRSYERFLQMDRLPSEREDAGLQAVFQSVFPITDFRSVSQLEFVDYRDRELGVQMRSPQGTASPAHHLQELRSDRSHRSVSSWRSALQQVRHLQRQYPRLLHQVRRPGRHATEV